MPLRDIMLLVITPSVALETLAGEFRHRLPRSLRVALGGIGGTRSGGEGLLSYLLFDAGILLGADRSRLSRREGEARRAGDFSRRLIVLLGIRPDGHCPLGLNRQRRGKRSPLCESWVGAIDPWLPVGLS